MGMTKTCEHCRQPYRPKHRPLTSRYCSRVCSAQARPRSVMVAAGHKGGTAKAAKAIGGVVRRQARAVVEAGLTPVQAFAAGANWQRRRAYGSAYRAGRSRGYEEGYEAACKDLGRRVA